MDVEVAGGTLTLRVTAGTLTAGADDGEHLCLRMEGLHPRLELSGVGRERLVGLGERYVRLNQRGRRWDGAVVDLLAGDPEDTYFYVPLLLSSAGYAVVVDSHARCTWDLRGDDGWSVTVPDGSVDVHLLRGTPKRIVERFTAIYGRAPIPPAWALGVWKTTLGGTRRVLAEAQRLLDADIPVTACWVYDHYDEATNSGTGIATPYPIGDYPSLPALTGGLHDLGLKALGYVQPCLYEGSAPYREAVARGFTVQRADGTPALIPYFNPKRAYNQMTMLDDGGAYVDLTNPEAARWFAGLLQQMLDQGWDGWMQDMGEHLADDMVLADGSDGVQTRNRYPLLYHRLAHGVWSARPDTAVFVRSGALGVTPYVPVVWPGDQTCTWDGERGLGSVLPTGPSVGLAGVGAFGPDIAGLVDGFDGGAGGRDEELWIRWCQYGALNPVMRDHLGFKSQAGTPVDLWSTPRTVRVFRDYARLHNGLLGYLRELAAACHQTGLPMVRGLLLEFPDHDEAWTIDDQYLLGDALLVAPVHTKGARSRRVWFPPGEWIGWWDERAATGPGWADVDAALERIPLFRRAGWAIGQL